MSTIRPRTKIKPPKKQDKTEKDFNTTWETLSNAIDEIFKRNSSKLSYEQLYRAQYVLVLWRMGAQLYDKTADKLRDVLSAIIKTRIMPLMSSSTDSSLFLQEILTVANEFSIAVRMISDIMIYCDRVYSKEARRPIISDMGLYMLRTYVLSVPEVQRYLFNCLLSQINEIRRGRSIDLHAFNAMIQFMQSLTVTSITPGGATQVSSYYEDEFEPEVVRASADYYSTIKDTLLQKHDASVYFAELDSTFKQEERDVFKLLAESTHPQLIATQDQIFFQENLEDVFNFSPVGLQHIISLFDYTSARLAYQFAGRVDLDRVSFKQHLYNAVYAECDSYKSVLVDPLPLVDDGTARTKVKTQETTHKAFIWIQKLVTYKRKLETLLEASFDNSNDVQATIDEAFISVINSTRRAPEFVSLYLDDGIRRSDKLPKEELSNIIETGLSMFKYLKDADLFQTYYQKHLAKRLLNQRVLTEADELLILKLKDLQGVTYAHSMLKMCDDVLISEVNKADFEKYQASNSMANGFSLSPLLLREPFWPTYLLDMTKREQIRFPDEVKELMERFEQFYRNEHDGRVLNWVAGLGSGEISTIINGRTYDIIAPTFGMVILLQFNDIEEDGYLTIDELEERTNIGQEDLSKHLLSMILPPRTRILRKEPMNSTISGTDRVFLNREFVSKQRKIRVALVTPKSGAKSNNEMAMNQAETEEEHENTLSKVNNARELAVDAAIIRVMKANKSMHHTALVMEVIRQLTRHFEPDVIIIKKRVEVLIDKDYLERSCEDASVYQYKA
ncbi:hypothetical protein CANCADRAFT_71415 [Tortispora caseinolytica NRRL Y-17796]|uniref:Cullin family profile domain-containing protein n=1 Tax=Tortispora caseinolytica NRRL Y-17796 TaxID=767744 RepID=A0A1E4TI86_9ASCO|nr:hypothetical protein CANCADRAFT_71415 [Tortispora caseinolytica NRRL Y-17796]